MKLKNKKLPYSLLSAFLIAFVWYFVDNRDDFRFLSDIDPRYLIAIAVGHFLTIYTNGLLIKWLIKPFNKNISNYEGYYVALLASIGNYFLPAGSGLAMRAVYLKKKVGLNYKAFLTTLYGNYIILFLCYGLAGLVSLVMLVDRRGGQAFYSLLLLFTAMVLVTGYLAVFGNPKKVTTLLRRVLPKATKNLVEIVESWNLIANERKLLLKMTAVTLLWFLIAVGINYASIASIGASVSIWVLILYSALNSISLLINITPGSLGIREGMYIYAIGIIGLTIPQILASSIIERGVKGVVLVAGWFFSYIFQVLDRKESVDRDLSS